MTRDELIRYIKVLCSIAGCDSYYAKKFKCDMYLDCESCLEDKIIEHDKQIRADVIDEYKKEVLSRFCEYCDQYACNGAMIGSRQECTTICMLRDVYTDIANELKEQK